MISLLSSVSGGICKDRTRGGLNSDIRYEDNQLRSYHYEGGLEYIVGEACQGQPYHIRVSTLGRVVTGSMLYLGSMQDHER